VRTVKRKYEDEIEEDIGDDLACLAPLPRATSGFKASPAFTVKRAKKSLSAPSQRTIDASADVSRGGAAEPKFVSPTPQAFRPTPPDEPAFSASNSSSSRRNSDFMARTTPALAFGSSAGYSQQQQYQKAQQTPVWSGYDRAMLPGFYSPAVAFSASTPASAVRGGFSLSQGSADGGSTFGLGSVSSSATTASATGDGGGGRFAAARRRVRFNAVTSPTPGSSGAGSMTAATAATATTTAAAAAAAASGATGSATSLAVSSPWQPRSDAELVWQWSQTSGGASPAMVLQSPVSTAAYGYNAGWQQQQQQQQQQQLYNRAVPSTSMMASPSPRSPLQRHCSVNAGSSGSGSSSCSRISSLLAASALLSGHSNSNGGSDENSQ
jgi:hypothetical protein